MITVPAIRLHQFGVYLYQALLGARDVDRLVRFEVLSYGAAHDGGSPGAKRKERKARVNWELLEKRIAASAEAYQRPVIRKKIAELVEYYGQCADTGNLPAIPGAVLLVAAIPRPPPPVAVRVVCRPRRRRGRSGRPTATTACWRFTSSSPPARPRTSRSPPWSSIDSPPIRWSSSSSRSMRSTPS